jgi:hypothetical protein
MKGGCYRIVWDDMNSTIERDPGPPDGVNSFSQFGQARAELIRALQKEIDGWQAAKTRVLNLRVRDLK